MTTEKLQKVLANAGLGSRRQLEEWIIAGRVSVDGKIAQLGERVTDQAKIRVDGRLIRIIATQASRILLYHKPEGEICTRSDPENRPTVFDHLPMLRHQRWIQVGRLDFNTSGLLLFTNDGELANRLMHPSQGIEREYAVRILGEVSPQVLQTLTAGVNLEDGLAKFDHIQEVGGEGANRWYHVTLSEGRNREVRRLWESQGLTVSRLSRVRFGELVLPRALKAGRWQEMTETEVNVFLNSLPTASVKITDDDEQPLTTNPLRKPQGSKPMTAKPPITTRRPTTDKAVAPKRRISTLRRPAHATEAPEDSARDTVAPKHRRITATATGTENRRSESRVPRSTHEGRTASPRAPYGERAPESNRPARSTESRSGYEGRTTSPRRSDAPYGERTAEGNRRPTTRSAEPRNGYEGRATSPRAPHGERGAENNRRSEFRSSEPRSGYEGRKPSTRRSDSNAPYGERTAEGNRHPASRSAEPRHGYEGRTTSPRAPYGERTAKDNRPARSTEPRSGYEGRKPVTRNGNQQAFREDYSNASRRSDGQRFLDANLQDKRSSAKPTHYRGQPQDTDHNNASRRSDGQRFLDQSVPSRGAKRHTGPRPNQNGRPATTGRRDASAHPSTPKPRGEVQDIVKGQLKPRKPKTE